MIVSALEQTTFEEFDVGKVGLDLQPPPVGDREPIPFKGTIFICNEDPLLSGVAIHTWWGQFTLRLGDLEDSRGHMVFGLLMRLRFDHQYAEYTGFLHDNYGQLSKDKSARYNMRRSGDELWMNADSYHLTNNFRSWEHRQQSFVFSRSALINLFRQFEERAGQPLIAV